MIVKENKEWNASELSYKYQWGGVQKPMGRILNASRKDSMSMSDIYVK